MFHFRAPVYPQGYFPPHYPAYDASPAYPSAYPGQVLGPRDQYLQALVAAQEAEEKLQAAEQLRREELQLRRRLREIEEQQVYTRRPSPGYYHHQPLAFDDEQVRNLERPSRLEALRREIEEEERRQREEAQYQELLRRKQQEEEAEYEALLRRKEALLQARAATLPQIHPAQVVQPLPEPVTVKRQDPVKPRVQVKPSTEESPKHVVFDPNSLFEAFFGHALGQPTKAEPSPPAKKSDPRLTAVEAIQSSFEGLRSTFVFPTEVSFNDSPADGNPISKLAYSSINKPIREYEQALNKLISELDEISSSGDETLRLKRKQAVLDIEKAIEELEGQIEARWVQTRAQNTALAQVENTREVNMESQMKPSSGEHAEPSVPAERALSQSEDQRSVSPIDVNVIPRVDQSIQATDDNEPGEVPANEETVAPVPLDFPETAAPLAEEALPEASTPEDSTSASTCDLLASPVHDDSSSNHIITPSTNQTSEYPPSSTGKSAVVAHAAGSDSTTGPEGESDTDNVTLSQSRSREQVVDSDWSDIEA